MYIVTWMEDIEPLGFLEISQLPHWELKENWSEVQEFVAKLKKLDNVLTWSISMVIDGMDHHLCEGPQGQMEKGLWFDNISKLLPDYMSNMEVLATLMNIASKYWDAEDMKLGAEMMVMATEDLREEVIYKH